MFQGGSAPSRRLPFHFQAHGGVGRLALADLSVGLVTIDKLELEVAELGTDPGVAAAERFQRRRTRLRGLAVRIAPAALDERVAQLKKPLAAIGITQLAVRLDDGYVSVRARAADGLATADLSFHLELVNAGAQLRAVASAIRVHGHLPTPGPVIADRLVVALLGAGEASGVDGRGTPPAVSAPEWGRGSIDRPGVRGLCDVELDLVGALLWHVLPPSGWRLPAVSEIELTHIRVARAAIEIAYGPAGARGGELGVRQATLQLAAAHDLMHSVDQLQRDGHLEEAMRGYRALLASSGPDQPLLLERILALAAARPAWFFDGLELARQALGRWPRFAPAHAALASITLAQGDAREAAKHLEEVARMASADGDDDQTTLAALAAARLLRVLDPRAATQLYQLALQHDAGSAEAADSLADRLADEQRWPELARLLRGRIASAAADPARAVQLHLQLADMLVHQLGDPAAAQHELAAARALAPDDPAVHEMMASILVARDPAAATVAWREVARLAERRGDHRTGARAWASLGDLLVTTGDADAEDAWRRSLELDPLEATALVGLASAAAARNDHGVAADLYERLRGLGLAQDVAARHELGLARSLVALGRGDDARASLRRATLVGGETGAEAHAVLAELAEAAGDREQAAAELDVAIAALIALADDHHPERDRLYARAAALAVARATLFDRHGQPLAAADDWQRAHALARQAAPEIARDAARTLLARSDDDGGERRWIDAVLATRPPPVERAALLVRRAEVRRRERSPDLAAAIADLHEAVALSDDAGATDAVPDAAAKGVPADSAGTQTTTLRRAHQLEAELFAQSGDQRSRAQSLAAIAKLADRAADRVESETAAAAAWLAADEPAAALPHGSRAHAQLAAPGGGDVPPALRREVLITLGEAAWRQRAWPDVIRAYRGLLDETALPSGSADGRGPAPSVGEPAPAPPRMATFRYRLALAADRTGDPVLALAALRPLVDEANDATRDASPELRGHALKLFADLAERAGDLIDAARALEGFAAIGGDGSAAARADAVYRAGELFRRADRGDDAVRCLESALRISEHHLPALDALEAAWRERKDLERVAVILGRKVAATARQPQRQKPLLSRLGDLQDQLRRPDVALATHQRALEIDPMWRPSLRYVTLGLRDGGQVVAAAGGLAQLAGELHGDHGVDLAIVTHERKIAAEALAELVATLDDAQLDAVRAVARPALERAVLDNADVATGLARLRGELASAVPSPRSEDETHSGPHGLIQGNARSLREAAARARAADKLDEAFATLEAANHVNPGDVAVLRELIELAGQLGDHTAVARHLTALAQRLTGARRGDVLLELADAYYDRLDDAGRGRDAMRQAAAAFGSGSRRDATLRMLASEAGTHLAWDIVVESLQSIPLAKRTMVDVIGLATALMRAGRDADAVTSVEAATDAGRLDDDGELLGQLHHELQRKTDLIRALEERAIAATSPDEAAAMLDEAQQLRIAIGQPGTAPLRDTAAPSGDAPKADTAPWPVRTKTKPGIPNKSVPPAPVGLRPSSPSIVLPPVDAAAGSQPAIALPSSAELASTGVPVAADPTVEREPSNGIPIGVEPSVERAPTAAVAAPVAAADPAADDRAPLPLPLAAADDRAPLAAADDRAPLPLAAADDRAPNAAADDRAPLADDRAPLADDRAPLADDRAPLADDRAPLADDRAPLAATDDDLAIPVAPSEREIAISAAPTEREIAISAAPTEQDVANLRAATDDDDLAIPVAPPPLASSAPPPLLAAAELGIPPAPPLLPTADLAVPEPSGEREPSSGIPKTVATDAELAVPSASDDASPAPRRERITAERRAVPSVIAHSTSMQMSAADAPDEPAPPPPPRARDSAGLPALGRIKLVHRTPTRPGLGSPRPAADASSDPGNTNGNDNGALDDDDDEISGSWQSVSNPELKSGPVVPRSATDRGVGSGPLPAIRPSDRAIETPPAPPPPAASVTVTGSAEDNAIALLLAAGSADRDRLFAARRADPDDPSLLLALLAHLGDREPALRRELLDEAARTSHGTALAIALHELAVLAREAREPTRAAALWTRAHEIDPRYAPVWMPLADALAASDDYEAARELYEAIAHCDDYDAERRAFAADRAETLGHDASIVSGEIVPRGTVDLEEAKQLAEHEDWPGAIDAAERAAAARPNDPAILEVLEKIYFASGNVTAASDAIGRQLALVDDPAARAQLWRRRARMYREALGRDADAYRCLKEAHACAPADPEIAYQLRTAAMVRAEWPLTALLLHREIAAAASPRDRGALHLELALIFEERLDDPALAQANYELALTFDPTIPAVKLPLARRYEAIGRMSDAARLYEEAAATARAADRAGLLEAAARCRSTAAEADEPDLAAQLDRAEAAGDLDAALELANQLWRAEPGHPAAFRLLANTHRTSGDLAQLTELTRVRASRAETPDERATAWLEVARLAEEIGALDRAARAYDLALIEDPGHVSALDARGALAFRLADFATADLIYRDLGTGESVLGDDELALRRSIIAEQLGRDSEALHLAQAAAVLAPGRRDVMMRVQELATRVGELPIALAAARHLLELVPLDDDEAQLATHFALIELLRESGRLDDAVAQLEKILRDHPVHAGAIEALAQVHTARGDWPTATRYLYQLVPLAPSPSHRAERLYQLGEAVLTHVHDVDRADDVFLRASDLDPGHVPTLRRLLDVYWRADDPGGIVEVATELADKGALISGPTAESALAHALVAAALVGDTQLAQRLQAALGDAAPRQVALALAELAGRSGRLQLVSASTAISELARRGLLDLAKLRAAAAGTPVANAL